MKATARCFLEQKRDAEDQPDERVGQEYLEFLSLLADFMPLYITQSFADTSDLAKILFKIAPSSSSAAAASSSASSSSSGQSLDCVSTILRIFVKIVRERTKETESASTPKTPRLNTLLLGLCDVAQEPTRTNVLHARLAMFLLAQTGGQHVKKLVQKSVSTLTKQSKGGKDDDDEDEEEDDDDGDERNCVAMQNLASLAKHAPAQLKGCDLEGVVGQVKGALGKKQVSRVQDEASVLWYEAAMRFLFEQVRSSFQPKSRDNVDATKSLLRSYLDLLWHPKAFEQAKRSAVVCLLHLWSDRRVQEGRVFSSLDLARLAWVIPSLSAETRGLLNAKLFKLTRKTNAYSFVAFQAFFALQPEASLLPRSKQFLLNSVLLRRRNHVVGEIPNEFLSFFLLVPCLMRASALADAQAVLKYYIKTVAAPQKGEKEDHRTSLAQVIFVVQDELFVSDCTHQPPLAPALICDMALEILGVTPERGGLSGADIINKLPWLASLYTLQRPTKPRAAARDDDDDDEEEGEGEGEGGSAMTFSAPPRVRKTPTTPLKNKRAAPTRRQRTTPVKAATPVKKQKAAASPKTTKRRRTSPASSSSTTSPVTPSRRSLPRSCKSLANVLDSSDEEDEDDDEEEEEEGEDNNNAQSEDDNSDSDGSGDESNQDEVGDDDESDDDAEEEETKPQQKKKPQAKAVSARRSTRSAAPFRTR